MLNNFSWLEAKESYPINEFENIFAYTAAMLLSQWVQFNWVKNVILENDQFENLKIHLDHWISPNGRKLIIQKWHIFPRKDKFWDNLFHNIDFITPVIINLDKTVVGDAQKSLHWLINIYTKEHIEDEYWNKWLIYHDFWIWTKFKTKGGKYKLLDKIDSNIVYARKDEHWNDEFEVIKKDIHWNIFTSTDKKTINKYKIQLNWDDTYFNNGEILHYDSTLDNWHILLQRKEKVLIPELKKIYQSNEINYSDEQIKLFWGERFMTINEKWEDPKIYLLDTKTFIENEDYPDIENIEGFVSIHLEASRGNDAEKHGWLLYQEKSGSLTFCTIIDSKKAFLQNPIETTITHVYDRYVSRFKWNSDLIKSIEVDCYAFSTKNWKQILITKDHGALSWSILN